MNKDKQDLAIKTSVYERESFENTLNECVNLIKDSVVSDVVDVNVDELKKLGAFATDANAEMLIADTVPISDIEIRMLYPGVGTLTARVVVEPEFAKIANNLDDYKNDEGEQPVAVLGMALTLQINKGFKRSLWPVVVEVETGKFRIPKCSSIVDGNGKVEHYFFDEDEIGLKMFDSMAFEAIQAWYFIQVCLTNPPIRERFAALSKTKTVPKGDTKKKRGAVRYVKTHYLDPEEWGIIKRSESGRTYTCLAWYVIGHWREYKNGHRVFIKPYWKGTMRNSVEEAGDVSRNRIVAQMEKVIV